MARRDAICTTLAELKAKFAFPPDQDAGPIYEKILALTTDVKSSRDLSGLLSPGRNPTLEKIRAAAEAVKDASPSDAKYASELSALVSVGRHSNPEQIRAANVAAKDFAPVYALAVEAADRPHCSLVSHYNAPDMSFPIFASLKGIAKCLAYRARKRAESGDWRGALLDIRAIERTGRHASEDPTLIAMFVGNAINAIGERTLDEIIDRNSHDAAFLSAAKRLSEEIDAPPNLKHAILGDYLQSLMLLSMSPSDPAARSMTAKVLRHWRLFYEALPKDPERWQDGYPAARRLTQEGKADPSTRDVTLDFPSILDAVSRTVAYERLTATALRLLLDRSRMGLLPASLPSYGPVSVDPFTDKPLKYRREGAGFLLYSVGQDRVDNGGKDRPADGPATTGFDDILPVHSD